MDSKSASEISDYARYYINAEVWSSDRLQAGKNIYRNRYSDTSRRFRGFWQLMSQWKGSVLKLIWHDLMVFLFLYIVMNLVYRWILFENAKQCTDVCGYEIARQWFELICVYCGRSVY